MKKSCAIGCAALFILLAAIIGVVIWKAPGWVQQGKGMFMDAMAEEARISAFENAWTPPVGEGIEAWAPATVGEWKLKQSEQVTGWPELNLTRAGQWMIYENGARTIEVGVIAATDLEKDVLVTRIVDAAKEGGRSTTSKTFGESSSVSITSGSNTMTTSMGNRTHVKINGTHHTRTWWLKDRLFFFRTKDADPAEFAEQYLTAISAPTPVEAVVPLVPDRK